MTLEQALLILTELRESIIASTMQIGYMCKTTSTPAERLQALDVVLKELEENECVGKNESE